jgi:DNA-binding beta-propeller fold protein YncE
LGDLFGSAQDRMHLWDWLIYRHPFGDRGARWLYFLVRRDLVPNAKQYKAPSIGTVQPPTGPSTHPSVPVIPARLASPSFGVGQLAGPRGVASDSHGNVYTADTLNHRIVVFSPTGKVLRTWGSTGTGPVQFNANSSPMGVAVGADGLVYVADTWNERIQVFTMTGQFVRQWGGGPIGSGIGQFYGPRSLAVGRNGRVYVADTGNKRIQVFSPKGQFVTSWGTPGTGPGQFDEPSSVAIGPTGTVYVADFWNQRIQAFTPSGKFLRSWPVTDWVPHSYDEPYLAVDPRTGRVFASDPQSRLVLVFTSAGRLLGSFGSGSLAVPIGVAVQSNGHIVVSDATGNQISVYRLGARPILPKQRGLRAAPTRIGSPRKTAPKP